MRVTNAMISDNAMVYVGANKGTVDANNTRMTTQKKIDRPSEDPVVAIRSLRLQTSLDKINQFYDKNIPDATSWMDVTETALLNIKDIMTDVRTLCVQGSTDTLTEDDRKTIYTQLKSLQEQLYKEGNADYAGRTVFTGFRTNKDLVFSKDEAKTSYSMQEPFEAVNMTMSRFYTNKVTVPTNEEEVMRLDNAASSEIVHSDDIEIQQSDYYKLSMAYNLSNEEKDDVTGLHFYTTKTENGNDMWIEEGKITFSSDKVEITDSSGAGIGRYYSHTDLSETLVQPVPTDPKYTDNMPQYYADLREYKSNVAARKYVDETFVTADGNKAFTQIYEFETETDWESWSKNYSDRKYVPDDAIVIIKEHGDIIAGTNAAMTMMNERAHMSFDYQKTGFLNGELKPEYYFDSTWLTDSYGVEQNLDYDRYDKSIRTDENGEEYNVLIKKAAYSLDYTVSQNQTLGVNLEADQCFDHDLYQDMNDMIEAVSAAQLAHEKVTKIKAMMHEDQYQTEKYQEKLGEWLKLAEKEMDYYDNNMSKLYSTTLGKTDVYLDKINLSITDLGCRMDRCKLTESRMSEQQETVEELKSINDDMDLSEILMRYTSSYNAYQSSLVAAGKLGDVTLLNYI